MTKRSDLVAALTMIQNHPAHANQDILTIHGCRPVSNEEQLRVAIEHGMATIARWSNYAGNKRRLARAV